eukprot:3281820-Rhodomonas_salina.2
MPGSDAGYPRCALIAASPLPFPLAAPVCSRYLDPSASVLPDADSYMRASCQRPPLCDLRVVSSPRYPMPCPALTQRVLLSAHVPATRGGALCPRAPSADAANGDATRRGGGGGD